MNLLQSLESALPITVYFAVLLFIVKECIEFIKKINNNKIKIRAIKELLAEETEKNYWVYKVLRRTVDDALDLKKNWPAHECYIKTTSTNQVLFCTVLAGDKEGHHSLPEISTDKYEKILIELAQLDQKLFIKIQTGYSFIKEIGHVRKTLIETLEDTDEDEKEMMWEGFLGYANKELEEIFLEMKNLYYSLKSAELEKFRLR